MAGGASLSAIQARVDARVAKVIGTLTTAHTKVDASTKLTAAQKTTIDGDIATMITDLGTIKSDVDGATTRADLKSVRPAVKALRADVKQLRGDVKTIRQGARTQLHQHLSTADLLPSTSHLVWLPKPPKTSGGTTTRGVKTR